MHRSVHQEGQPISAQRHVTICTVAQRTTVCLPLCTKYNAPVHTAIVVSADTISPWQLPIDSFPWHPKRGQKCTLIEILRTACTDVPVVLLHYKEESNRAFRGTTLYSCLLLGIVYNIVTCSYHVFPLCLLQSLNVRFQFTKNYMKMLWMHILLT